MLLPYTIYSICTLTLNTQILPEQQRRRREPKTSVVSDRPPALLFGTVSFSKFSFSMLELAFAYVAFAYLALAFAYGALAYLASA